MNSVYQSSYSPPSKPTNMFTSYLSILLSIDLFLLLNLYSGISLYSGHPWDKIKNVSWLKQVSSFQEVLFYAAGTNYSHLIKGDVLILDVSLLCRGVSGTSTVYDTNTTNWHVLQSHLHTHVLFVYHTCTHITVYRSLHYCIIDHTIIIRVIVKPCVCVYCWNRSLPAVLEV